MIRHFITDHERKHLIKLNDQDQWPLSKDETTKFFFEELRNLRSIGLIRGQPNKGIRSLDREEGDINQHFEITEEGKNYLKIYYNSEFTESPS